jgi:glucokinase
MNTKSTKTILTLDAGGTNLVFNAINSEYDVIASESLPTSSQNIEEFINKLIKGFHNIHDRTNKSALAISFCFPGPADYENGIIGNLENLPFFKGGVPLKNILEKEFNIPVFINNDGDLFALGEAMKGILPNINNSLANTGGSKQYQNLLGITLGTGTGGGIVLNGKLLVGDNSAGAEINRSNNYLNGNMSIEETLSIRGIKHLYCVESGLDESLCPESSDIYEIGMGTMPGSREAAITAWNTFGTVLGHTLANAITLIDGIIVIGGGLAGAYRLFIPKAIEAMNGNFVRSNGQKYPRLEVTAYNLENKSSYSDFIKNEDVEIVFPLLDEKIIYTPQKKVGIGISKLGTSEAVAIGAYSYAIQNLNSN